MSRARSDSNRAQSREQAKALDKVVAEIRADHSTMVAQQALLLKLRTSVDGALATNAQMLVRQAKGLEQVRL